MVDGQGITHPNRPPLSSYGRFGSKNISDFPPLCFSSVLILIKVSFSLYFNFSFNV